MSWNAWHDLVPVNGTPTPMWMLTWHGTRKGCWGWPEVLQPGSSQGMMLTRT